MKTRIITAPSAWKDAFLYLDQSALAPTDKHAFASFVHDNDLSYADCISAFPSSVKTDLGDASNPRECHTYIFRDLSESP